MLLYEIHDSHNKQVSELVDFVVNTENGALSAHRVAPLNVQEFKDWCEEYCPHNKECIDNAEDVTKELNNRWASKFFQYAQQRQV